MAFNNTIRQLTVDDTNHASNFNEINNKLLENTLEIANTRGYLTTVVADGADFNTLIANGKYKITGGTNKPDNSTSSTFLLDVTVMNSLYIYQQAECLYSNAGNTGRVFYRFKLNNIWQPWDRILTASEM